MNFITKIPVLGYLVRLTVYIIKLPSKLDAVQHSIDSIDASTASTDSKIATLNLGTKKLDDKILALSKNADSLSKELSLMEQSQELKTVNPETSTEIKRFADNHLLDLFYTNFEDRFRGEENQITERLTEYLPDFQNNSIDFNKYPVLDIGSGRGEFLEVLKQNKIQGKGLDINIDMVNRSIKKGLDAVQGDATSYLNSSKPHSFGAITGFHIVEHIPFDELLQMFKAAYHALVDDGFVLFETPNPENIIVGSCAFYTDPSHLNPIPPELLAFAIETCGFRNIEIRRLHPVENNGTEQNLPSDIVNRFYGPRDYAVIAYK